MAAKEVEETDYWLQLCKQSESYPFDVKLQLKMVSIQKLLGKIISTLKRNP